MDSFRFFCESYTNELYYLLDYLKKAPVPIINYREDFGEWVAEDEDRKEEVAKALGISPDDITGGDDEWVEDLEWETLDKLPKPLVADFEDWWRKDKVQDHMMHGEQTRVPTWAYCSLNRKSVLPRTTWLVHLTDDPYGVADKGFTKGCDDMETLGLTTYLHQSHKSRGGYNFAFEAGGRDMIGASNEGKYGKHAVMFQSSGVDIYHNGDEENQVIFWGPAIKPRDIVIIRHADENWVVETHDMRHGRDAKDGGIHKGEDLKDCTTWVESNFQQYRKVLTGF